MTRKAVPQEAARIGWARDSTLRTISDEVTRVLAGKLDEVIFAALCCHFGGPYFAFEDLRGRCQHVISRDGRKPDLYTLDGQPILEVLHGLGDDAPLDVLRPTSEIHVGFRYRIVPPTGDRP